MADPVTDIIIEEISVGDGDECPAGATVNVHYRGTLMDGTEFDSSYSRGEPITFPLGNLIQGWQEGIQLMRVGSKYRFINPPDLAYGEQGAGNLVRPNATLLFEVELLGITQIVTITESRIEMPVFSTRRIEPEPAPAKPEE